MMWTTEKLEAEREVVGEILDVQIKKMRILMAVVKLGGYSEHAQYSRGRQGWGVVVQKRWCE